MRLPPKTQTEHNHCSHNKEEIYRSKQCACFYCEARFEPSEIKEWISGDTALCPRCSVDSVIGDASGIDLTDELLKLMHYEWFSLETALTPEEVREYLKNKK